MRLSASAIDVRSSNRQQACFAMERSRVDCVEIAQGVWLPLMGYGTYKITDYDTLFRSLDCALNVGYRLIDTAHLYQNEHLIGTALKELLPKYNLSRKDIFLTSKFVPEHPATDVRQGVLASLDRLGTNYIDLMLVHQPMANAFEREDPRMEQWKKRPENKIWRREVWLEMEKLLAEGLVRSIGVSSYVVHHLEEIPSYATVLPSVNQIELHPHFTRQEVLESSKKLGIYVQAFTSLGRINHEEFLGEKILLETAEKHSASVAQVLLAWAIQQGIGVLPKSTNNQHIESNFNAVHVKLSESEIQEISKLNKNKPYSNNRSWQIL